MRKIITEGNLKSIISESIKKILYGGGADKYECLNEARSWSEGMKKNGCPSISYGKSRTIISEGIQFEPESNEKGGIIVFSTDVNAVALSPNRIANWIKQKIATFKNRHNSTKKVDRIANRNNLVGWTIGHYLDGRYRAKNGQNYGENSLSLMIVGVDTDGMIKIAEEICKEFQQESVLLKDFSTGRILFVDNL